jgi:hypothetical protein
MKEKPKKFGFPPHAIISEYHSKNTKNHVLTRAANWLLLIFSTKRKKGIAAIEKMNEATNFNAVKASRKNRNIPSKRKNIGLYRSPKPLKSYP